MDLLSTLSQYPKTSVNKIKITDNVITFPISIDVIDFYNSLKDLIKSDKFTPEKAIYAASLIDRKPFLTHRDLIADSTTYVHDIEIQQSTRGF